MSGPNRRDEHTTSGDGGRAATLEELWERHGRELERLADRVLGDPGAVDAACYAVMLEAGAWLATSRRSVPHEDARWWLRKACAAACARILDEGVPPEWVTDRPLLEALPGPVRSRLWFRAARRRIEQLEASAETLGPIGRAKQRDRTRWRGALEDRLRGLAVLLPLPQLAQLTRRAWEGAERAGRDAWRRVEVAASAMPGQRVAGLLGAGPGLPEAAAVVTAFVAVGVAAPDPPPPPTPIDAREVASTLVERRDERSPDPDGAASTSLTWPDDDELAASSPSPHDDEGSASEPDPGLPAPGAEVGADPKNATGEPVQEKPRTDEQSGTWYYVSPGVNASADVDEDGEEDAVIRSPQTGVACAPPSEREAVGRSVCTALDDSNLFTEQERR